MSKAIRSACRAMLGNDPFGRPFSGTVEEVNELEPERLRALFANAVARAPMRIVSVGPLGTDEIGNRMLGVFGGHNRRPAPRPSAFRAPEGVKRVSEQSPGKADQALLFLSLADAKQMRMTDFAATMAIFSGSSLSRIYKRIREERQLVYSHVSLASHSKRLVCIAVSARPGKGEEVLDTLEAEVADMAKAAPSEQEMQAMKREMATSMLREMDSPRPMLQLLSGLVRMQGEPDPVKHLDGLLAVRPSRVRAVMESARPFGRFVASGTGNGEEEEGRGWFSAFLGLSVWVWSGGSQSVELCAEFVHPAVERGSELKEEHQKHPEPDNEHEEGDRHSRSVLHEDLGGALDLVAFFGGEQLGVRKPGIFGILVVVEVVEPCLIQHPVELVHLTGYHHHAAKRSGQQANAQSCSYHPAKAEVCSYEVLKQRSVACAHVSPLV